MKILLIILVGYVLPLLLSRKLIKVAYNYKKDDEFMPFLFGCLCPIVNIVVSVVFAIIVIGDNTQKLSTLFFKDWFGGKEKDE